MYILNKDEDLDSIRIYDYLPKYFFSFQIKVGSKSDFCLQLSRAGSEEKNFKPSSLMLISVYVVVVVSIVTGAP